MPMFSPDYSLISLDTETTGVGFYDRPFCITYSWREQGSLKSRYLSLVDGADSDAIDDLLAWLADCESAIVVMHNAKFDLQKLDFTVFGPVLANVEIHDTMVMYHLLDEHSPKGLKPLAERLLGESTDESKVLNAELRKMGLKKADGYHHLPREVLEPYALKDAEFTYRLYEILYPQLLDSGLQDFYREELRFLRAIIEIEGRGLKVNRGFAKHQYDSLGTEVCNLEVRLREHAGYEEFLPNSPKQVKEVLSDLGFEVESTGKAALKEIDHPFAATLITYRDKVKQRNTYYANILEESEEDGLLHPYFNPCGTVTGRLSSSKASQ